MPSDSIAALPPVDSAILELLARCPVQRIENLSIAPGANQAEFAFATCWPTVPIVEVFDARFGFSGAEASAFPALAGMQTTHRLQLHPLRQNTRYLFRVTAGTAVATGTFMTGALDATFKVMDLTVWRDGDPNGSGEMWFLLGAFNATTANLLAGPVRYPASGTEDLTDGQVLTAPWNHQLEIHIPEAPLEMGFYAIGWDDDDDEFFGGLQVFSRDFPTQLPSQTTQGGDGGGEFADALATVVVPDGVTSTGRYVTLDTGNTGVHFTMRCVLDVRFTPPAVQPRIDHASFTHPPPRGPRGLLSLRMPGSVGGLRATHGTDLFTVSADGGLFWQAVTGRTPRGAAARWRRIGDHVTLPVGIARAADGSVEILSAGTDGRGLYGRLARDKDASPAQWTDLAGTLDGEIVAVRGRRGLDLFALDRDGAVVHRSLGRRTSARSGAWQRLSHEFATALCVVADAARAVHVFVIDRVGCVQTAVWSADAGKTLLTWRSLGGNVPGGVIGAATTERSELGLVVIDRHRIVYAKARQGNRWRPARDEWESLGSLDGTATEDRAESQ